MKFKSLFLFTLFSVSLLGQKKEWTLEDCVEYALENNIQIKQSQLSVETAENNKSTAVANYFPDLSLNSNYGFNFGLTTNPITNISSRSDRQTGSLGLNANWILFDGGRNWNNDARARVDYLASVYRLESITNDIAINVSNQYLQILLNKELVSVAQEQVNTSQNNLERIQKTVNAGVAADNELFAAQAQLALDEQTLISTQNNLNLSLLSLAQLLQLENHDGFDIAVPEIQVRESELLKLTPQFIYNKAVENQPQVKAAEADVESAEQQVDVATGNYLPIISINGSIATSYTNVGTNLPGFELPSFEDQLQENLYQYVGINLRIPIFSKFQNRNQLNSAKLTRIGNQLALEDTKNQLRQTIERAHADAKASLLSFHAAEKSLAATRANFSNANKRLEIDAISPYDYETIKNDYLRVQSELIRAKYDFVFKIAVLEFYLTNQVPTNLSSYE